MTLSSIIERLRLISETTVSNPTHIVLSERDAFELLEEYNNTLSSPTSIEEVEWHKAGMANLFDLSDYIGLTIIISQTRKGGFKILEEITPYNK